MLKKGQSEKIKEFFNSTIDDYDTCDDYVVPKNDELHDTIVKYIPFSRNQEIKVLDLGIGTGNGAQKILEEFPKSHVTGIDFSSKMIAKARKKLNKCKNRVKLIENNFNKIEFPEKYDVIVSAVAIHNNTDEEKKELIKKIFRSLNEGGCFINGDFIISNSKKIQKNFDDFYKEHMRKYLKGDELKTWFHHAFKEDLPTSIEDQFKWLKETGFKNIDSVWQFHNLLVYFASK